MRNSTTPLSNSLFGKLAGAGSPLATMARVVIAWSLMTMPAVAMNSDINIATAISTSEAKQLTQEQQNRVKTVLFVDRAVADYQQLISNLSDGSKVVVLDAEKDGVLQITETLATYQELDSIQILSHGNAGQISLGSSVLKNTNLDDYRSALRNWGKALANEGDILIYGCDVAANAEGERFVSRFAQVTQADVAASNDKTGASALAGNWDLEFNVGQIDTAVAINTEAQKAYGSVLTSVYASSETGGANPLAAASDPTAGPFLVGDFDTDGDVDLVKFNDANYDTATFYQNNGSGAFTALASTNASSPFRNLAIVNQFVWSTGSNTYVADFDNDGDLDIWDSVADVSSVGASIYLENVGGSTYVSSETGGANPLAAASDPTAGPFLVGDFDTDGDVDLVKFNDANYNTATFYQNNGSGTFTALASTDASSPFRNLAIDNQFVWSTGSNIYVADFDNDGDLDIWDSVADVSSVGASIYLENVGGSTYVSSENGGANPLAAASDPTAGPFLVGDFDTDGDVDLVKFNDASYDTATFYQNNGSGAFTALASTNASSPFRNLAIDNQFVWSTGSNTYVADFDNDGDLDIWDSVADATSVGASIYLEQTFSPPTISSSTPADNATGISGSANIVLNFNETITTTGTGTGTIEIRLTSNDTLIESIPGNDARVTGATTSSITINPTTTLSDSTAYYILINKRAFFDADGMTFQGITDKTVLNFTTGVSITVPGAPTSAAAIAGDTQATVTFVAPASDGGSVITGYTVTSNPAGGVDSNAGTTSLSHTMTGLTNGTAYTFTVKATNAVGTGAASLASNSVTPKASQTISFGGAPSMTYGGATGTVSATATSGLTVVFSSTTTGVCTVSGTTVTAVTGGTCIIAANQAGNTAYNPASQVTQSFAIAKASQTIGFGGAPSMTYGGATGMVSATATSGLAVLFSSTTTGVCTVSGTTVTAVTGGTCTIAANQAGNTNYNTALQVTQSFSIAKASQSISFGVAPSMTYGGTTGTVSATATSGLTPAFSSTTTGVCTISGTTVTAVTGGTCIIAANQSGNTAYNAASQVTQSFAIAKASQSISFGGAPSMTYGGATGTVSATATSGLAVLFSSTTTGICTVSGTTVTAVTVGTCIIAANQAGNTAYNPASQVTQSFAIAKASQAISFGGAPSMTFGGATGTVSATATSGLTVVFSSTTTGVCTVSGTTVTAVTGGTCIIAANQAGNAAYNAAPQVTQSFAIAKASQSISFGSAPSMIFGGATGTVSGTATSGLTVVFSSTTTGVCTVSGATVTAVTAGTCIIVANQAGNTAYNAASQVTQSFAIAKASQAISFGGAPSVLVDSNGSVSATGGASGNAVTFSSTTTNICSIAGTTVTGIAAGTCIIAANQAGDTNYNAAPQVTQIITVSNTIPGAPTIGSATASNAQASVSFSAPVSTGGSVITAYTVTSSPGGFASSGCTASPCTVMGLTNGTSYSFKVTATNAVGTGGASASSNSVTPATIPDAPTIGAATGGETEATVSFIAPADDGGNAISSYTVTSSPDGIIASGTSSPLTVTGLTDGTAYTFIVVATNGIGDSLASGASNSVTPDSPPVLTAPVDVTINAVGLFTPVDTGTATAIDSTDGALTPTSDAPSHFAPGVHTVTWSVTDSASHTVTATQTINVIPLVGFSIDQTAREGDTVTIKAILNGMAVTYPVTVPYTVSGTSDASDHDLVDGVITIASNLEASVAVSLVDNGAGEGDETLIVTMGTPTNAVKGATDIHTTTITEINLAPEVVLTADQSSGATTLVTQLDGSVTVTATVTDSVGDSHSYDWSTTDNALIDTDAVDDTFSFDPSSLPAGVYTLRVNVTDNNSASSEASLILNVAAAPVLTATDSDGDGTDDDIEGHGDDDNDGIVNYLDNGTLTSNVTPGRHARANQFLMETEPGLKVRIGNIAFRAGKDSVNVNMDDVTTHANDGAGATSDKRYGYNSGMFDFVIHQLPAAGQSVRMVLAQQATIPADAVYRKYANGVWQQFVEDTNNSLASATGEEGYCPPPGDVAYTSGLTEGDWCVQLTIEDGGPNDADGKANRSISDPGGVTEQPSIVSITGNGGGAISGWALILMSTVLLWRLRRQHQIAGSLLVGSVLLAGAGNANAVDESLMPSYVGISYLMAKSDERAGDFNAELAALGLNATVTQTDLSRSGYTPYIGYRFDETFGVEVAYVDLGEVTTRISGTSADINTFLNGPATVYPVTARGLSAALVLSNKVTPTGTLMAKIGVFDWKSDYTLTSATTSKSFETRDSNFFWGLAMEMEFMPHVPVRFGWNNYRVKDIDVRAWELGVAYRF